MSKKILGILGGMGPLATSHFFQEILRWTDAKKDWDHLRIIIDNNVDIPSRTRALLYGEESPVIAIRQACFNLIGMGCKYIAVPCNSAHDFYDEVVRDNEIPWVNMIETVSNELRGFKSVLVLGGYTTITKKTYDKYLNNTIYLQDNDMVYKIIEDAKVNSVDYDRLAVLYSKINKADAGCVLLACTELPIILNELNISCEMIDGNKVYIKKLIKMCGGSVKSE